MNIIFLLLTLVLSSTLSAQDEFVETQKTVSTTFNLPLRLGTNGAVSFFDRVDDVMFAPMIAGSYSSEVFNFVEPISFSEGLSFPLVRKENLGWIEHRKRRYDGGLGVTALMAKNINLGLFPFKGAIQSTIRHKLSRDEKLEENRLMPASLNDLAHWRVGDQGAFHVYGGVEASLATGVSIINLARVSISFQNQFIVELNKISDEKILFSITEENLKRSESSIGPLVSKGMLNLFRGNRFKTEFILNLRHPEHHELYQLGLKGKISVLQSKLTAKEQMLTWHGHSRSFFIGVPYLINVEKSRGHYQLLENGVEADLRIQTKTSKGFLATEGQHDRVVYRKSDGIVLVWKSRMKKASAKMMDKYFFRIGRSLGISELKRSSLKMSFGNIQSSLGIEFTTSELESLKDVNFQSLDVMLRAKCEDLSLNCKRVGQRQAILKQLKKIQSEKDDAFAFKMGTLLMKYPALISSVIRAQRLDKSIQVKFLSDVFQSLEGSLGLGPL